MAAMTQMISKKNFGRATGLMEIVQIGQFLIAPAVAGGLMGKIGLAGVVLIDFSSFLHFGDEVLSDEAYDQVCGSCWRKRVITPRSACPRGKFAWSARSATPRLAR